MFVGVAVKINNSLMSSIKLYPALTKDTIIPVANNAIIANDAGIINLLIIKRKPHMISTKIVIINKGVANKIPKSKKFWYPIEKKKIRCNPASKKTSPIPTLKIVSA